MNNFEHSQQRWQAPPFTPDVLLIERKTEPGRQGYKKEQLSHVKQNTTRRTNGDLSQQWNVSVKWVQPPIKGNKKRYKFGIDSKLCRRMLKKSSPTTRLLTQSGQKRSQRSKIRTEGIRHTNIEQCQQDSTRVLMETRSTCALLREEKCLGIQKKEKSGS